MLLSSTGLTYGQHFCGESKMMEALTIGELHLSCGMEVETDGCSTENAEDHDCCNDHYTNISTDENFTKASFDLGFPKTFITAFVSVFVMEQVPVSEREITLFLEYNPPPLLKDIPVLYETFLI
ncbi:hypothetical protein SCB49_02849 [unidentified eubacterium SCB49]|nr:hypothetical protein SCB49_02849 [unidentified eubacterium SCB49]